MSKVNEVNLDLAQRLLKLRQQNSLTQEEFAQKIGVTRQAVSRWEMGISTPSAKTLLRISEEFKTPLDRIIGCDSINPVSDKKQALGYLSSTQLSIILLGVGLIGLISLPFLAEMKQAKEMEIFKSAYEHSYHYITEFPLFIILIISFVLLSVGLYLLLKRRFFYEEKND